VKELDRVRELLAWHAQGVLTGPELAFMDQWLKANLANHPEVAAELAWLRNTAEQLQAQIQVKSSLAQQSENAGLNTLMQRIALEKVGTLENLADTDDPNRDSPAANFSGRPQARSQVAWGERIGVWLNGVLGARSPALALGVAAVVIAQASVIGALLVKEPASQTPLSGTASDAAMSTDKVFLTIAFNPLASELALRTVLASANAQIVAGPSALGLYTVAVPSAKADTLAAQLLAAAGVVDSVQR
jgi:hypothetical protein